MLNDSSTETCETPVFECLNGEFAPVRSESALDRLWSPNEHTHPLRMTGE